LRSIADAIGSLAGGFGSSQERLHDQTETMGEAASIPVGTS